MLRAVLLAACFCLLSIAAPSGFASGPQEKRYTAGGEVIFDCTNGIGGACFLLDGDEISVIVSVRDDRTAHVAAQFVIHDELGIPLRSGSFCDVVHVNVPTGSTGIQVRIESSATIPRCISAGAGTFGTIRVAPTTVPAPGPVPREDAATYLGGGTSASGPGIAECKETSGVRVGVACFAIAGVESKVRVHIYDRSGKDLLPVGGSYAFRDEIEAILTSGPVCGITTVPVPTGARELVVWPGRFAEETRCTAPPTVGTVWAYFE